MSIKNYTYIEKTISGALPSHSIHKDINYLIKLPLKYFKEKDNLNNSDSLITLKVEKQK